MVNTSLKAAVPFLWTLSASSYDLQRSQRTALAFSLLIQLHSNSLRLQGLQNTRLPYPSPSPGVCSNLCPLSRWCHPTISSPVIHFSWLGSFPASGSFPMSWLFASGGQRIGTSALASVLPMNIQDWSPLGWTGWMSVHLHVVFYIFMMLFHLSESLECNDNVQISW